MAYRKINFNPLLSYRPQYPAGDVKELDYMIFTRQDMK